jgi:hypothetical protein
MTSALIGKAQRADGARRFTVAEIAASCVLTLMTIWRNIRTDEAASGPSR